MEYYEANGLLARRKKSKNLAKIKVSLESEEKMVYASLSLEPKEVNQIAKETALPLFLLSLYILVQNHYQNQHPSDFSADHERVR